MSCVVTEGPTGVDGCARSLGPPIPQGSRAAVEPHVAPVVANAVSELIDVFGNDAVRSWADGNGGAQVVIDDVPLSRAWTCSSTWIGFAISHLIPEADTYPLYVRADLAYADGRPLVPPLSLASFEASPAVQISRRRRPGSPAQAPAEKVRGVLAWLRSPA